MSSENIPARLRRLYDEVLAAGGFPVKECRSIRIDEWEHFDLVMWIENIAGIASHGERLTTITEARKSEFKRIAASDFFAQQPSLMSQVTQKKTPKLWALLHGSEQARLLIQEFFKA